ncbi:MAG: RidA family protein, partial [Gemmatimonadetes bacterium]|nr:RidA family protein [Gemmatimonadota bacterium]
MDQPRAWHPVGLPDAPPPRGAYSRAVRAGNLVFVSGQVPRDPRTGQLLGDDIESQTRAVLTLLADVLAAAGARMDDVVAITAYLQNIGDWEAFNRIYAEAFRPPYPSRTTVGADLHGVLV